ncbi:RNA polymerase sigma-70 factor [Daejeonella sp.]|uniref:RNA polymerase sigma-70 factor n=1 Tax=Daejeonella sp. TaxID=2805397 RepID=UPI0039836265
MNFPDQCNNISADWESLPPGKVFEQLFKTYYPRLCHFSFQIVRDKVSAEDLVQEAFIKYWGHREEISTHDIAVKNFLYSTVRNASLNLIRHHKVVSQYLEQQNPAPIEEFNIIHSMIRSEVLAEIHKALEILPESCQRISRMGYLEGMKNSEIAQKLGLSINTVKTQKQRGLQLLRVILKPEVLTVFIMLLQHHKS